MGRWGDWGDGGKYLWHFLRDFVSFRCVLADKSWIEKSWIEHLKNQALVVFENRIALTLSFRKSFSSVKLLFSKKN
ncbi:MAG: hypothetical protein SW833_22180 [Cyanobacteriota bacterium]|nr:hypothetical protein [Cyanobacteriota bacterium]